jgi:hypothetical protein
LDHGAFNLIAHTNHLVFHSFLAVRFLVEARRIQVLDNGFLHASLDLRLGSSLRSIHLRRGQDCCIDGLPPSIVVFAQGVRNRGDFLVSRNWGDAHFTACVSLSSDLDLCTLRYFSHEVRSDPYRMNFTLSDRSAAQGALCSIIGFVLNQWVVKAPA